MWMDYESEMGALSSLTAIKNFAMLALASRQARDYLWIRELLGGPSGAAGVIANVTHAV